MWRNRRRHSNHHRKLAAKRACEAFAADSATVGTDLSWIGPTSLFIDTDVLRVWQYFLYYYCQCLWHWLVGRGTRYWRTCSCTFALRPFRRCAEAGWKTKVHDQWPCLRWGNAKTTNQPDDANLPTEHLSKKACLVCGFNFLLMSYLHHSNVWLSMQVSRH